MPRPIQALIDPQAIRHNLARVRAAAGDANVWAVVKANAYGHGIERVFDAMRSADGFALLDLSEAERNEREEFVIEACRHMRDRFDQRELWQNLGLPMDELAKAALASENMRMFRQRLFSRIVPVIRDIGLWSPKVQQAFADMGAIQFADTDVDALLDHDEKVAEEFDARRHVTQTIGQGAH